MSLRGDPLQELLELQERVNRLFDETLGAEHPDEPRLAHGGWLPAADVLDTGDAFLIEVELPGLTHASFTVHAAGSELVLRGERPPFPCSRPEAFHRLERRHGPFTRVFRFSEPIDAASVSAELSDGVLHLRVPKPSGPAARRVPVERATGRP